MVAKKLITGAVKGVIDTVAPVAKEITGGDLALKAAVDSDPTVMAIRAAKANTGGRGYGPGSQYRGNRATDTQGAYSTIYSEAQTIKNAYPNEYQSIQAEVENWVRGGYAYARDTSVGTKTQPLKDYPRYVGPDGRKFRLKPKQKYGAGYRLSTIDTKKLKGYGTKRASREKPWTNEEEMENLMKALSKVGKAHQFAKLVKIMKADYNAGMAKVRTAGPNMSKGHLISLKNGGLDVAENFMPQQFRNTTKIVNGKKVTIRGNPAMQADSTTEFAAGKGISSWDDYVRMKLSQLE